MAITYPVGYGTQRVTMEKLISIHGPKMHPAFRQRLFPWLASRGGFVGIGGGWRYSQPNKPGFAPEGRSFHQNQLFKSGFLGYAAVDLVVVTGSVHRAPRWSEVPNGTEPDVKAWGLHCFISGEPWHMQPYEIRGWGTWVNQGRPDPQLNYPIPHPGVPDPPPIDPTPPPTTGGSVYVDPKTLRTGSADHGWTEKLQAILPQFGQDPGPIDGQYGPRTEAAVINVQRFFRLTPDGICGPKTWGVILGVAP